MSNEYVNKLARVIRNSDTLGSFPEPISPVSNPISAVSCFCHIWYLLNNRADLLYPEYRHFDEPPRWELVDIHDIDLWCIEFYDSDDTAGDNLLHSVPMAKVADIFHLHYPDEFVGPAQPEIPKRQYDALIAIHKHCESIGLPPTITIVSDMMGITRQAARKHVVELQKRGLIALGANKAALLTITDSGRDMVKANEVSG